MAAASFQPYDIFMLVVLGGTILFGFWKGMAWQFASVASIVLSIGVAIRFSPNIAHLFGEAEPWNRFIAMFVLFLITSLLVWGIFRLVSGVIDRVRLKEFDRQAGALLGLIKGVLYCVIITFFAVTLSETLRGYVLESYSGRYIALLIERATPVLPEQVTQYLGEYIEEFDRKLDPDTPADDETNPISEAGKEVAEEGKSAFDEIKESIKEKVGEQIDEQAERAKEAAKEAAERATGQ
ncbi:MAG: CvpA family protein [Planctomycetia bacterium]|jgi:membrane protein required for colicin V production